MSYTLFKADKIRRQPECLSPTAPLPTKRSAAIASSRANVSPRAESEITKYTNSAKKHTRRDACAGASPEVKDRGSEEASTGGAGLVSLGLFDGLVRDRGSRRRLGGRGLR